MKKIWLLGIVAMLFMTSFVVGQNIQHNYVLNESCVGPAESCFIPWIATSDGRPKIDMNLINITAGNLQVTNNVTAMWLFGNFNWTVGEGGEYIFFNGSHLDFNETYLNATIIAIAGLGPDGWNITGSEWLYNNTGILAFNETHLNTTIDLRAVNVGGDTMTGNLNMSDHNITNVTALYVKNVYGYSPITVHDNLDATGKNITASNFFGFLNWSYIQNKFITAVDGVYLYISGGTITLNETALNATIASLDTDTHVQGDDVYLYNDSTTMYFNETKLNATITALDTDTTISKWSLLTSEWMYNNSGVLEFNETHLNTTIGLLDTDTHVAGDLDYLTNDSTTMYYNETKLNATIDARSDFDTDTHVAGDNDYLTNDSTTMYYNETKLNATIDARSDFDTDTHVEADNDYLTNDSTTIYFNETKLNATIDARDTDTTYTATNPWMILTGAAFSWNSTLGALTYLGIGYDSLSNFTNDLDLINSTYANSTYILQSDEGNLNVNSSTYWDDETSQANLNVNHSDSTTLAVDSTAWITMTSLQAKWFADVANVLTFDEAELNTSISAGLVSTYYNMTTSSVVIGTPEGVATSVNAYDDVTYNITEVTGDIDYRLNFSGVSGINQIVIRYISDDATHSPTVYLWDYGDSAWESYTTLSDSEGMFTVKALPVFDGDAHVNNSLVQMRIYSLGLGVNHKFQFDWITVSKGIATPSGTEVDPLSIHRGGDVELTGNWDAGSYNITAVQFIGTCDYADEAIAMNWTGLQNYPAACGSGAITQLNDSVTCTDSWVELAGDTMTGNLIVQDNVTVEYLKFETNTSHTINDNATCIILTGSTSTMKVC